MEIGQDSLAIEYASGGRALVLAARLRGEGPIEVPDCTGGWDGWITVLSTEDPAFAVDPRAVPSGLAGPVP